MLVVVSYDIKDNRKRDRISKILKGFGDRVQLSVFECLMERRDLEELKEKIGKVSLSEDDSVIYYALCRKCASQAAGSRAAAGKRPSQQQTLVI